MKRTHQLLTATVIGTMLALAGCGGDKASAPATGTTKTASATHINLSNGAEPESLDPQRTSDMASLAIVRQMFIGLVGSDATGKTTPAAAESWETTDNKVWTFKLRKDLKWSNGDPLTAKDFVYALQRLTDPKTGSPYGGYLVDAKVAGAKAISDGKGKLDDLGVKATNDHTLVITLDSPVPYFAELLTLPVTYAVPQKAIETHGEKWLDASNIVVSGAYKLKEWIVNEKITLEKNPNYFDNAKTKIETVSFLPIAGAAEINRYKAGELDVAGIVPEQFAKIKSEHGSEVRSDPKLCTFYLEHNTTKAPLDNPKVRQAISMVLEREVVAGQILNRGEVPSYQFAPKTLQGMTEIKPEWANLDKAGRAEAAKKLLEEAGYTTDKPLQFEILYSTSETAKRMTTAIASMINKELPMVKVSTINQEWKTSLDTRRQGKFQSAFAGWCADYNEPSSFYNVLRTGGGNNASKYSNPEYDALLDKILTVASAEERNALYQQAEQMVQRDNPVSAIYVPVAPRLVKSNLKADSLSDPLSGWQVKDWTIE